jgi:hypothetical protein
VLLCPGGVPETPGSPLGTEAPGAPPGTGWLPGVPVCPKLAGIKRKVDSAADNSKSRNFIAKPRFSAPSGPSNRLYPWKQERSAESSKRFDAESLRKVIRRG